MLSVRSPLPFAVGAALALLPGTLLAAARKAFVPDLLRTADYFENDEPDFPQQLSRKKAAAVREAVAAIRVAEARQVLIRIR